MDSFLWVIMVDGAKRDSVIWMLMQIERPHICLHTNKWFAAVDTTHKLIYGSRK